MNRDGFSVSENHTFRYVSTNYINCTHELKVKMNRIDDIQLVLICPEANNTYG